MVMEEQQLQVLREKLLGLLPKGQSTSGAVEMEQLFGSGQVFFVGACGFVILNMPSEEIAYMSSSAKEMLGLEDQPTFYQSLRRLMHPAEHDACAQHMTHGVTLFDRLADARTFKLKAGHPLRMKHSQGHYLRLYRQLFPLQYDEGHKLSRLLIVFTDISHLDFGANGSLSLTGLNGNKKNYKAAPKAKKRPHPSHPTLSSREIQVLRLVAENYPSRKIAEALYLSTHTVRAHRKNMLRKTGTGSSLELVMLAKEKGWI